MGKNPEKAYELIDLTLRFDRDQPNPDRFLEDPKRPGRPDPNLEAPERPIRDYRIIADLFHRGNLNYYRFIQACRAAAGKSTRSLEDVAPKPQNYLFLNERGRAERGGHRETRPLCHGLGLHRLARPGRAGHGPGVR
jgi:hypothetical protein